MALIEVQERRAVSTRVVDRQWLFNNMFVGPLVVDVRPAEHVAHNTLLRSVHVPPMEKVSSMDAVDGQLVSPHRESFTPAKRFLREVVIVGELSDENRRWQHRLTELLIDEGKVVSIATVSAGFTAFYERYPFYTTAYRPLTHEPTPRITYPSEILDRFLYLGNMWQAKSERYHEVKIQDQSDADIASHFDKTFLFIASVRAIQPPSKHFRVLVHCTQGISRSATLVIMYLMRAEAWSLVTAFNYMQRHRPVVIPNAGFFRALLADERRLYCGKNSLDESEIDALLQGRIPDRDATLQLHKKPSDDDEGSAPRRDCQLM